MSDQGEDTGEPSAAKQRELELLQRVSDTTAALSQEIVGRQRAEDRLAELRALEMNDDVVQNLAVAKLALELGRTEEGLAAVNRALDASKALIARWSAGAETLTRDP